MINKKMAKQDFWLSHDSTDYVDWSKAVNVQFPNLKLTSRPITIRIPVGLLDRIKIKANSLDIPYQSLIKQTLADHFLGT